jgi:phage regulator Rha-like protein
MTVVADTALENKIYEIRNKKVMIDSDLAGLYGVETKRLKEAVRRNADRFPADFMFELTSEELESLRTQIASSKSGRGGLRYLPMAFTEQGVSMLSSVLNSKTAIQVNIQIIRVFTKMRELLFIHKDIMLQLQKLEKKVASHDEDIAMIFKCLKELLNPPQPPRRRIGFRRINEAEQQ